MTFPPPIATTPVMGSPDLQVAALKAIAGVMAGLEINRLRIGCDTCGSGIWLILHPDGELRADLCDECHETTENDVERQLKGDYEAANPDGRVMG